VISVTAADLRDQTFVDRILNLQGFALIFVDSSVAFRLPFRGVRAVFYSLGRDMQILDGYTGLFLSEERLSSELGVALCRSYAASVTNNIQATLAVVKFASNSSRQPVQT